MKKIVTSTLVVFVLFLIMDYVLHSILLSGLYAETAHLWRSAESLRGLTWIIPVVDAALAFLLVWLFAKGWETGKPWLGQGIRFGLVLGLFFSLPMGFSMYSIMPVPFILGLGWFVGALVEVVVASVVTAWIFRS